MNQAWGFQIGGLPSHLSGLHQGLFPPCRFHFPAWVVGRRGAGMVWEAERPLSKEQQQMVAGQEWSMKSE